MILATYFSAIFLIVILVALLVPRFKKKFVNNTKSIVFCIVVLMSAFLLGLSYWQYKTWLGHPLSKFFLPPYQSWYYFFTYVGAKIFAPYAISLSAAIILFAVLSLANRKFGGRFFEKEEISLISVSVFLVGYPGWIFYIALAILIYLGLQIFYNIKYRGLPRVSMYYLWVPLALFVIIVMQWVVRLDVLKAFKI